MLSNPVVAGTLIALVCLTIFAGVRLLRFLILRAEAQHPMPDSAVAESCTPVEEITAATPIERVSHVVAAANRSLEHARRRLSQDRHRRIPSMFLRFVDIVSDTAYENAEHDALSTQRRVLEQAKRRSLEWIHEKTLLIATRDSAAASRHAELVALRAQAAQSEQQLARHCRLATTAVERMRDAQQCCESAASTEVLDVLTTSKLISSLSTIETGNARDAIEDAAQAVAELRRALPSEAPIVSSAEAPNDLPDLCVDILFAPSLDFLSVINMCSLDDAARQCAQSAATLQPLATQLRERLMAAKQTLHAADDNLRIFEAPHRLAAIDQLPSTLRPLIELRE